MSFRLFYHLNSHKIFLYFFLVAFACQILFWKKTEKFKPSFDLVPPVPSRVFISTLSFGDKEFLFRVLATRLQNSGDVFAGFVSLKNYDYSRIYQWLKLLDYLNDKSNFTPALASYYYSQTPKSEDVRYIVNYLDERAATNNEGQWWWLIQAIYIAKNQLYDINLALDLAHKVSKTTDQNAPFWVKQMPAFIAEQAGDGCLAFGIISKLIAESESGKKQITAKQMDFMRYFIKERLTKLQNEKFDPRKCRNKL